MGESYQNDTTVDADVKPDKSGVLFRNLARLAADAIILANEDGAITFWNQAAAAIFGFQENEIMGRPLTTIMPGRYRERHVQGLARHRSTGESLYFGAVHEYHGLRKDGAEFPAEIAVSTWRHDGETVFAAIVRDTSQRNEADRIAQESRERYRSLVDACADAVSLMDPAFRILICNEQKVRLYGYDHAGEIIGMNALDLVAPADRAGANKIAEQLARNGLVRNCELTMVRKNGSVFPAELSASQVTGADGRPSGFTAIVRDVSDRKASEDRLRAGEQHYQKLFHQSRDMERSIRSLSQRAIHAQEEERRRISRDLHDEVGQSLTAITVLLESSKKSCRCPAASKRHLLEAQDLVEQSVGNLRRVCHELHPDILEHLGLIPALRWYAKKFAERTSIKVQFRVTGDPGRLNHKQRLMVYRIVQEGLTNTLKHASAKHVTIEMGGRPGTITLAIHDDGKGFSVGRGLNPARDREGVGGQGLLGIQERVRLAGGGFEVQSARGKGTTIRVNIAVPMAQPKRKRLSKKKPP
ncbi:MAG: PAS domain S-box protein [Nitrospirae bacterium]|nr:PAS domain S-box protein [Nitrospirota bacterium]